MTPRPFLLPHSLSSEFILEPLLARTVDVGVPDVVLTTSFRVFRRCEAFSTASVRGGFTTIGGTCLCDGIGAMVVGPTEWAVAVLLDAIPKEPT